LTEVFQFAPKRLTGATTFRDQFGRPILVERLQRIMLPAAGPQWVGLRRHDDHLTGVDAAL
jgi:hypothetical protein